MISDIHRTPRLDTPMWIVLAHAQEKETENHQRQISVTVAR